MRKKDLRDAGVVSCEQLKQETKQPFSHLSQMSTFFRQAGSRKPS